MYDALETVRTDIKKLETTLKAPDAQQRVARIAQALEQCAQEISEATRRALQEDERAALQKIYRGMIAARRMTLRLHELAGLDSSGL
jgi:signal transduction protein with GAF and PtsI domain